jgi:hypothetical protein
LFIEILRFLAACLSEQKMKRPEDAEGTDEREQAVFPDPSFRPCHVTAYSGHKGDDRPSSLTFEGRTVTILRLRSMRIEEDLRSRERKRFFHALGSDGKEYTLLHHVRTGRWYVRQDE